MHRAKTKSKKLFSNFISLWKIDQTAKLNSKSSQGELVHHEFQACTLTLDCHRKQLLLMQIDFLLTLCCLKLQNTLQSLGGNGFSFTV